MKDKNIHTANAANQLAAHHFREHSGKMVAELTRTYGIEHLDNIMDVIQDTFETALRNWRFAGIPDNPSAWLMKVARNKLLNTLKHGSRLQYTDPMQDTPEIASMQSEPSLPLSEKEITDSELHLMLACCHPALTPKGQIIITLHILCGFGVPEIANALLMSHEAVKKALARSKAILRNSDIGFGEPVKTQLEAQSEMIHAILYLMFNEGYKTTRSSAGINKDLCYEAIRLAKILLSESKTNDETNALLALMFFNVSRFHSRLSETGEWLTLEEQDRSLWDKTFIEEGIHYLNKTADSKSPGKYHLEALIASIHCLSTDFEETDWERISFLYRILEKLEPGSPALVLNRMIAESYLSNTVSWIPELEIIEAALGREQQFMLLATKGYLYENAKNIKEAIKTYKRALDYAQSPLDKAFIRKKISSIDY